VTHAPPKFKLGTEIRVGYEGIYRWDEMPGTNSRIAKLPGFILSMRLLAEITPSKEVGEKDAVTYPRGWEYFVARQFVPGRFQSCGDWIAEAELLKHEYQPNAEAAT
jgi:hypothetical protein